MNSPFIEV